MISPTAIVAYLALFASVGFLFLFVNLVVGRLVRPQLPNTEKLEVYECGEPTIGSSFVQFDLRFYVVALLFIIFDVEVAFFFPWATVYGKACHLMDPAFAVVEQVEPPILGGDAVSFDHPKGNELTPAAKALYLELGVTEPQYSVQVEKAVSVAQASTALKQSARTMALFSLADIGAFFAILLVGFAYVWKRGDLDWVRAISKERMQPIERTTALPEREPALLP